MVRELRIISLASAAALAVSAASAQESVKLRIAHQFPQSHYLWEEGGKVFVDNLSAGGAKVSMSVFPAAQLGKDPLAVLQSGLADIVTLVPSYSPEKMPLTSVAELPGFHNTTCEGVHKLWTIIKDGAPLEVAEYKPLGIHVLFVAHQPAYKILTSKKQVSKIGDVSGLKIRANGASIGNLVRSVGGVPISMTSGEVYDATSRGTIDGTLLPYYTLPIYGLSDVVKYVYEGPAFGGGPVIYAMTDKAWQRLSDEMKASFIKAAADAQEKLCTYQDQLEDTDRQKAVDAGKITITTADKNDLAEWQKKFDEVAVKWAEGMERQGRPGQQILGAFKVTQN